MTQQPDFVGAEGVAFQGRITASVSHELNNVFATISETAGLSADLVEIGTSDGRLDTRELQRCAETIAEEVKRGFRVVKNLNVFAHSADRPIAEVDLAELVALMAELAGYLSYASAVVLEKREVAGPRVTTRPLLLEDLLYRAIVHAFRAVGPDGSIEISARPDGGGGRTIISGLGGAGSAGFVDDDVRRILQGLDGHVETDEPGNELHILLPRSIETHEAE